MRTKVSGLDRRRVRKAVEKYAEAITSGAKQQIFIDLVKEKVSVSFLNDTIDIEIAVTCDDYLLILVIYYTSDTFMANVFFNSGSVDSWKYKSYDFIPSYQTMIECFFEYLSPSYIARKGLLRV